MRQPFVLCVLCVSVVQLFALVARAEQKDADIVKMLADVDTKHIEQDIRTLAGFGTRHTLSDTASDTRGIGAARKWIESEMRKYAAESGGRMKVELVESTVGPAERIPQPVKIVDVIATLPG